MQLFFTYTTEDGSSQYEREDSPMNTIFENQTLPEYLGSPNMLHWNMSEEGATAILTVDERTCRYLPKLNNYRFALAAFDGVVCIGMHAEGLELLNENGWQVAYFAPHGLKLQPDTFKNGMPLTILVARSSDGCIMEKDAVELPVEFVADMCSVIGEIPKKEFNPYQFEASVKWMQDLYPQDEMFVGCA